MGPGLPGMFPFIGWEDSYTLVGNHWVDGVNATMYRVTEGEGGIARIDSQYSVSQDNPPITPIPVRWEWGITSGSSTQRAPHLLLVDFMSYHPHVVAREEQYQIPSYCPFRPVLLPNIVEVSNNKKVKRFNVDDIL